MPSAWSCRLEMPSARSGLGSGPAQSNRLGAAGWRLQREAESGGSFIGGRVLQTWGLQHFARTARVAGKPADAERTQAVGSPRSCLHHLAPASLPASPPCLEGRRGEPPCGDEEEALDQCRDHMAVMSAVSDAHACAPLHVSEPPFPSPHPEVNNQIRPV